MRSKFNGTARASNRVSKYLERWGADKPFSSLTTPANSTTTSRVLSITSLGFLIPTSHIAESPTVDQRFIELSKKFQTQVNFKLVDKLKGLQKHRPWKKSLIDRFFLRFSDKEIEYEFSRQEDTLFRFSVAISMIIFVIQFLVQIIILPPSIVFIVFHSMGFIIFMFFTFIYFMDCCMEPDSKVIDILLRLTMAVTKHHVTRLILALIFITIILTSAIISITECNVEEDIQNMRSVNATYLSLKECHSSQYYIFCCLLAMTTCSVFLQISFVIKLIVMMVAFTVYNIVFHVSQDKVFQNDEIRDENKIPLPMQASMYLLLMLLSLHILDRMVETTNRLDHFWKNQFEIETCKVKTTASLNKVLLENILPQHVAEYFLRDSNRKELYHESYSSVTVMFASIPAFQDVIMEKFSDKNSLDCLIFLHEIISTFDRLLSQATFMEVEKIKSIGSTYMAATGLFPDRENAETPDQERRNVVMMTRFALSMMVIIENWFNNYDKALTLRIGITHGPVIAGVIGARKPVYDIWGDTVNVASRMDSTGMPGKIQVPENTAIILKKNGFDCELRGEISVKGKPPMKTYLVSPSDDHDAGFLCRSNRAMTL